MAFLWLVLSIAALVLGWLGIYPSWITFDGVAVLVAFAGTTIYSVRQFRLSKSPDLLVESNGFTLNLEEDPEDSRVTGHLRVENGGDGHAREVRIHIRLKYHDQPEKEKGDLVPVKLSDSRGRAELKAQPGEADNVDLRAESIVGCLELDYLRAGEKYEFIGDKGPEVILDALGFDKIEKLLKDNVQNSGLLTAVFHIQYMNFAGEHKKQEACYIESGWASESSVTFRYTSSTRPRTDKERRNKALKELARSKLHLRSPIIKQLEDALKHANEKDS